MGSPTIFSGKYTKLLTQKGLLQQGGAVNQFDGNRNYIKNSTFEANVLDGWNRVKTTITSNLPTGTPTIGQALVVAPSIASFYVSGGSAPFDSYALYFGNPVTTVVAGEGIISDAFTVEPGDLGKVLTFKLYYKSDLGASTDNWSGQLASQTWAVYIYDQSANGGVGQWLQPAGFLGMNQNSGVGIVSGTFQSSVVSGQQYRIAVIALRNTTSTSALQIDNIYVGSQTAPIGPVMTDWVSFTPTGSWTSNTTYTGQWRRVGDSMQGKIRVALTGAPNNTQFLLNLPSGYSIDTSKLPNGVGSSVGLLYVEDFGLTGYDGFVFMHTTTTVSIKVQDSAATFERSSTITSNTVPFAWNNQDYMVFDFQVPISGWSSNVQLSNDTDTRVVAFNAYDGAQVAITNTTAVLPLGTTSVDTHAVRSGNTYVIPVSGFYRLSAKSTTKFSVGNTTFTHALIPYKNGVAQFGGDYGNADGVNSANLEFYYQAINSIFRLNAGDIIDFRYFTDYTGVATTYLKYCSIERLSGPSVVAASETVAARYTNASGQSIPNNSTTAITGWTRDYDTHSILNSGTGVVTIPISGKYTFSILLTYNNAASAVNNQFSMEIQQTGSVTRSIQLGAVFGQAVNNYFVAVSGLTTIHCNAGDTVTLVAFQNSGTARVLAGSGPFNHVSIVRVGN